MESLLRGPGAGDHVLRGAPLTRPEGGADEWMMAIVPGRFDQHAAQMGIARFGDAALRALRPARVLGRDETDEGHGAWGGGEASGIAELRRNRERGEIVDAAEAAQPLHTGAQGLEREEGAEILLETEPLPLEELPAILNA